MIRSYGLLPTDERSVDVDRHFSYLEGVYGLLQSAAFRHLVQPNNNLLQSRSPILDISRAVQFVQAYTKNSEESFLTPTLYQELCSFFFFLSSFFFLFPHHSPT